MLLFLWLLGAFYTLGRFYGNQWYIETTRGGETSWMAHIWIFFVSLAFWPLFLGFISGYSDTKREVDGNA